MALKSGRHGANMKSVDWKTGKIKDASYNLPIASGSQLGGVKVGSRLSIDENGVLSAEDQSYTLPKASVSQLGGVKVGSRLSIDENGVLSAEDQSYTLPIASASQLGGVKIGSNLSIDANGVLTVSGGSMARYISGFWRVPVATNTLSAGGNNISTQIVPDTTKGYFITLYTPNPYDIQEIYGYGWSVDAIERNLVIGCRKSSAPMQSTTIYFDVMEITYPTT